MKFQQAVVLTVVLLASCSWISSATSGSPLSVTPPPPYLPPCYPPAAPPLPDPSTGSLGMCVNPWTGTILAACTILTFDDLRRDNDGYLIPDGVRAIRAPQSSTQSTYTQHHQISSIATATTSAVAAKAGLWGFHASGGFKKSQAHKYVAQGDYTASSIKTTKTVKEMFFVHGGILQLAPGIEERFSRLLDMITHLPDCLSGKRYVQEEESLEWMLGIPSPYYHPRALEQNATSWGTRTGNRSRGTIMDGTPGLLSKCWENHAIDGYAADLVNSHGFFVTAIQTGCIGTITVTTKNSKTSSLDTSQFSDNLAAGWGSFTTLGSHSKSSTVDAEVKDAVVVVETQTLGGTIADPTKPEEWKAWENSCQKSPGEVRWTVGSLSELLRQSNISRHSPFVLVEHAAARLDSAARQLLKRNLVSCCADPADTEHFDPTCPVAGICETPHESHFAGFYQISATCPDLVEKLRDAVACPDGTIPHRIGSTSGHTMERRSKMRCHWVRTFLWWGHRECRSYSWEVSCHLDAYSCISPVPIGAPVAMRFMGFFVPGRFSNWLSGRDGCPTGATETILWDFIHVCSRPMDGDSRFDAYSTVYGGFFSCDTGNDVNNGSFGCPAGFKSEYLGPQPGTACSWYGCIVSRKNTKLPEWQPLEVDVTAYYRPFGVDNFTCSVTPMRAMAYRDQCIEQIEDMRHQANEAPTITSHISSIAGTAHSDSRPSYQLIGILSIVSSGVSILAAVGTTFMFWMLCVRRRDGPYTNF